MCCWFRCRTAARLIDLHGQFFALSESAARMLQDTLEMGPEEAAEAVARRWSISREQAAADLASFVGRLLEQGLLVSVDHQQRRPRLRQRLAVIVVFILIRLTCCFRRSLKGKISGLLTAARFSCRWLGWANTVSLWQRLFVRRKQCLVGGSTETVLKELDDAVRRAVGESAFAHACKERGLSAWALGRRLGLDVRLIIGLSVCPVHGHCWAKCGEIILGDDEDQCGQYEPMQSYGSDQYSCDIEARRASEESR